MGPQLLATAPVSEPAGGLTEPYVSAAAVPPGYNTVTLGIVLVQSV